MPKSKSLQAPGPFLAKMLEKYNLTPFRLSKDIRLSQSAVRLLVLGENRITVPVALRLAKYFKTDPKLWLTIQMDWEIAEAENDKDIAKIVKSISTVKKAAPKKKAKAVKVKAGSQKAKKALKPKAKKAAAAKKPVKKVIKPKKPVAVKKKAPVKKAVRKAGRKPAAKK